MDQLINMFVSSCGRCFLPCEEDNKQHVHPKIRVFLSASMIPDGALTFLLLGPADFRGGGNHLLRFAPSVKVPHNAAALLWYTVPKTSLHLDMIGSLRVPEVNQTSC